MGLQQALRHTGSMAKVTVNDKWRMVIEKVCIKALADMLRHQVKGALSIPQAGPKTDLPRLAPAGTTVSTSIERYFSGFDQLVMDTRNNLPAGMDPDAEATLMATGAYYAALDYSKTRLQGRKLSRKDPNLPPVPIIEHADVNVIADAGHTQIPVGGITPVQTVAQTSPVEQTGKTEEDIKIGSTA